MATRMQQRRGTAAQWTAANPILAAGEIGFETDTSKFKMGNGSSTWSALTYFANAAELAAIIEGAPALLNTLDELAAAMGDDPAFLTTIATNLSNHATDTTDIHGIANTALLATTAAVNTAISISAGSSAQDATTKANAAQAAAIAAAEADAIARVTTTATAASTALSTHSADSTDVHGIVDTAALATKAYADAAVSTHQTDTTSVHGIADTSLLATKAYADSAVSVEESARVAAVTAAVAALTKSSVGLDQVNNTSDANKPVSTATGTAITTAVSDHNADETNVHGIADTSVLVTQTDLTNAINGASVDQSDLAGTGIDWNSADDRFDLDNTYITTATQTALNLKAPLASPTFTGTVSGITSTMVGLGNVDNTSDANKPVSSATATALALKETVANVALKAPLASPALTGVPTAPTAAAATNTTQIATTAYVRGEVAALVNSAGATLDTLGEIATALGNDANLSTTLTTSIGTKAPIASPTFTGTVTIPAGASISGFAPLASPTFTGTNNVAALTASGLITASASGVAFTDGTQTKAGVPSITNIPTAIAAGAHALAAGRADQFIPLTGAVVITLPATGYSTGQSIDFYQESSTGAYFASTNGVVGTPGLKLRTTNSVATAMKTAAGWLVFGDLSA